MRAVQLLEPGSQPVLRDIADPVPRPDQLLVKVLAAGVCRDDVNVIDHYADVFNYPLPMVMGHECAGVIAAMGDAVESLLQVGDAVVVYPPWGCGVCRMCAAGLENYCPDATTLGITAPGLGHDGGCAEYMLVDRARHCVPIGDLDPVQAAPLGDAGLTSYHVVRHSREKLGPGSVAVVFGVGGLGHLAVQLLKHLTPATVVAIDVSEQHLELAGEVGADHCLSSDVRAIRTVRELTGGHGADAVLDFVGTQDTIGLGAQMTRIGGDWSIVGAGPGVAGVAFGSVPFGCEVFSPYFGTREDLCAVVALAQAGALKVHAQPYGLDDAAEVYRRLRAGEILGRAVLVP